MQAYKLGKIGWSAPGSSIQASVSSPHHDGELESVDDESWLSTGPVNAESRYFRKGGDLQHLGPSIEPDQAPEPSQDVPGIVF
jgi:hypothetical protein